MRVNSSIQVNIEFDVKVTEMDSGFGKVLKETIEVQGSCVPDLMKIVTQHLKGDDKENAIKMIQEIHILNAQSEFKFSLITECITKTSEVIQSKTSVETPEIKKIYCDLKVEFEEKRNKDEETEEISRKFNDLASKFDDEDLSLVEIKASINTIDPITKKQMVKPVKNAHCKHNYDYDTILMIMRSRNNVKCPYQGCVNSVPLKKEDLIPDPVVAREIQRLASQ